MASLQIPFTKWDWPSSAGAREACTVTTDLSHHSRTSTLTTQASISSLSDSPSIAAAASTCQSSDSYLSSMLLEGQAVLSHQLKNGDIWLFVGLCNGSIWKWTIKAGEEGTCLNAELVMTAHSSPIKALAMANYRTDYAQDDDDLDTESDKNDIALVESLVSLDEAGEMAVWNCHDGRCLLHNLRATASGKAAGFATSISVSPNSEFCVVSGFSDKLVVLRLASLEIVQIVEVGGGREPRWVRSAGFLLQDDPLLLLDYLTLNFNAPPAESLTARQFDPQTGRFVSAACPILPATLTPLQLGAFSSCHLLVCSSFNPGLAALVTKLRQVWLIDFLRGDHTAFMLDFEVDGVEFVRADLLLIWSRRGLVAFYQLFLGAEDGGSSSDDALSSSPSTTTISLDMRARSPLLGRTVRRLDVSCPFLSASATASSASSPASSRLHLRLLPRPCQLLWMEVRENEEGAPGRVSVVQIEFDGQSMDRTVYLSKLSSANLTLQREEGVSEGKGRIRQHEKISIDTAPSQHSPSPVTCMIPDGQDRLLQGHFNGQVSLSSVLSFFTDENGNRIISPPPSPGKSSAPITALLSEPDLIVAGDLQGMLHFWSSDLASSLGHSRAHIRLVAGIARAGEWLLSWSEAGTLALHSQGKGKYGTVHVFHPPTSTAQLKAIYFKPSDGTLLLDYRPSHRLAFTLTSTTISPLSLSDSSFMESIALSPVKIAPTQPSSTGGALMMMMGGVVKVQPVGWPQVPCHSLMIDVRALISSLGSESESENCRELAKAVLAQLIGDRDRTATPNSIRFGLIGANGNVSCMLQHLRTPSPTLTATLQLSVLVLQDCLAPSNVLQDSSFPSKVLQDCLAPSTDSSCPITTAPIPSLSLISKFWPDPHPILSRTARSIFSSAVNGMSEAQLTRAIRYWRDLLPSTASEASLTRSTIILAIIALQQRASGEIPLKGVADSLVGLLVREREKGMFRVAGVELIGKGYAGVWRPFVHGQSIFRLLFSWYRSSGTGKEMARTGTGKEMARTGTDNQTQMNTVTVQMTTGTAMTQPHTTTTTTATTTSIIQSTLLSILSAEPDLLLGLLSDAFSVAPSAASQLFQALLLDNARLLRGKEREIVEMLVLTGMKGDEGAGLQCVQRMSEASGTVVISGRLVAVANEDRAEEVVDNEEVVDIEDSRKLSSSNATSNTSQSPSQSSSNSPSQSQPSNHISVFDLKSKSKVATLAGHSSHPCTLLHFHSPRLLLSYSAGEATLRWWPLSQSGAALTQASMGMGSFFGGGGVVDAGVMGQSARVVVVNPELTEAVRERGDVDRVVRAKSVGDEVHLEVSGRVLMKVNVK